MSRLNLFIAQNLTTARFLGIACGFLLAIAGGGVAFAADPSMP
jgi:tetrahydromethanopterin S-methyltransferase subunit F